MSFTKPQNIFLCKLDYHEPTFCLWYTIFKVYTNKIFHWYSIKPSEIHLGKQLINIQEVMLEINNDYLSDVGNCLSDQ